MAYWPFFTVSGQLRSTNLGLKLVPAVATSYYYHNWKCWNRLISLFHKKAHSLNSIVDANAS